MMKHLARFESYSTENKTPSYGPDEKLVVKMRPTGGGEEITKMLTWRHLLDFWQTMSEEEMPEDLVGSGWQYLNHFTEICVDMQ